MSKNLVFISSYYNDQILGRIEAKNEEIVPGSEMEKRQRLNSNDSV